MRVLGRCIGWPRGLHTVSPSLTLLDSLDLVHQICLYLAFTEALVLWSRLRWSSCILGTSKQMRVLHQDFIPTTVCWTICFSWPSHLGEETRRISLTLLRTCSFTWGLLDFHSLWVTLFGRKSSLLAIAPEVVWICSVHHAYHRESVKQKISKEFKVWAFQGPCNTLKIPSPKQCKQHGV
jgi:hypothetical protein